MANIIYRETDTVPVRTESSVKAVALTYAELDGNFKLIDDELIAIKAGELDDGSIISDKLEDVFDAPETYGSETKVAQITVNSKGQVTDVEEVDIKQPSGSVYQTLDTNENITSPIPYDDTIPQISEGVFVTSASITPKSVDSKIVVEFSTIVSATTADTIVVSVFQNGDTNAVAAGAHYVTASNPAHITMKWVLTPAVTTEIAYSVRIGPSTANTIRLNGTVAARRLGGVAKATLIVSEIL